MRRIALLIPAMLTLGACVSTPKDPQWIRADTRCTYQSEVASGPPSLGGGGINLAGTPTGLYNLAMRQGHAAKLYDLCMRASGY